MAALIISRISERERSEFRPAFLPEAFLDYYELGVECFLIRGFDPLIDAIEYGRELISLTRKLVAERLRAKVAAE